MAKPLPHIDSLIASKHLIDNVSAIMKRVILTDSRTNFTRLFVNPPWRLGSIRPRKDKTFEVRMVHESGLVMSVNLGAELKSLVNRLEGW